MHYMKNENMFYFNHYKIQHNTNKIICNKKINILDKNIKFINYNKLKR